MDSSWFPPPAAVQLSPPSVLLNAPPLCVPAYTTPGPTARACTEAPSGPIGLHRAPSAASGRQATNKATTNGTTRTRLRIVSPPGEQGFPNCTWTAGGMSQARRRTGADHLQKVLVREAFGRQPKESIILYKEPLKKRKKAISTSHSPREKGPAGKPRSACGRKRQCETGLVMPGGFPPASLLDLTT